ncbi:hypothetical protein [Myxococcus landrumensis]|uniref:Uncharacterized protein n=1 Tax=Myxococcus landrumensis TaxID=2813577 RepID=A0ABX7NBQ1_9BACT|nr:hypothetical protein [Myxococcus landrumus]QSQ15921.1 hypothetical protein JY572_07675 [Myxococcus landrumus]
MLIFLRSSSETDEVITKRIKNLVSLDETTKYTAKFKKLPESDRVVVPWYAIDSEPMAFGKRLLQVAEKDVVCQALMDRASRVWDVDFKLQGDAFVSDDVQSHYEKQLKIWLSPLSGNIGKGNVKAHRSTVDGGDGQFEKVWKKLGLAQSDLNTQSSKAFFTGLNVAGRRDRIQIYRNVTEAARALVGEVTSWPSRGIEKIAVLSLLRSPGLAAFQRQMLKAAAAALQDNTRTPAPTYSSWEYLPYYLRGRPTEKVSEDFARLRVLGAIHDALNDSVDTRASVEAGTLNTFMGLEAGAEYRRWRMLPPVVRYQVLISDLARIMLKGKLESKHCRIQFKENKLSALSADTTGIECWEVEQKEHESAVPHDPGQGFNDIFPFASGWSRNELCPNVVSSRLMLAPLYAGTSGHNQGRILAWCSLAGTLPGLANIPIGLVISAGYSVLWRLYYDKRVSGFHTLFETFQGTAVDRDRDLSAILSNTDDTDVAWRAALESSPAGKTNVRDFWAQCIRLFGRKGWSVHRALKADLARARQEALASFPDAIIPRWNTTTDVDITAPDVERWEEGQNSQVIREYEEWERLASFAELPTGF